MRPRKAASAHPPRLSRCNHCEHTLESHGTSSRLRYRARNSATKESRGWRRSSPGASTCTKTPSLSTATRSPKARASAGSWVTIIIVAGKRLRSKGKSLQNSRRSGASNWPNGSSKRQIEAFRARIRPKATRCCCPPDNSAGNRSKRSAILSKRAISSTRPSVNGVLRPNWRFCRTRLVGNNAGRWKLIDTSLFHGSSCVTSLPAIRITPLDGVSKPATTRNVVVLPQPDGPTSASHSPEATSNSRSFKAWTPFG